VPHDRAHQSGHRVIPRLDRDGDPQLPSRPCRDGADHRRGEPAGRRNRLAHELHEASYSGRGSERDGVDRAGKNLRCQSAAVSRLPDGLVDRDHVDQGAQGAQPVGQGVTGLARARQQDRLAEHLALRGQRRYDRLGHKPVGDEVGDHPAAHECLRGRGSDRRDQSASHVARREAPLRQPVTHHLHGVLTGEDDPVVGRDPRERGAERREIGKPHDADRRCGDDVRAERLQLPHEVARLLARAGDRDASAGERVDARGTRRARRV